MKICICGGGSLGTVCAGVFSSMDNVEVNLLTQHPEKWRQTIHVKDFNNKIFEGKLNIISNNPEITIKGCEIVLLCLPGYLIEEALVKIKSYINTDTIVGSIVSSTGFFFQAHSILSDKTRLFGFQRVPFIARLIEYGHEVALLGYKPVLNIAVENVEDVEGFKNEIERLFMTPIKLLNNFYEACLTNSNPILHTGRLYSMWRNWNGEAIPECTLFYKEWDDDSSRVIIDMDKEFMNILSNLPVDKKHIPTLLEYYESHDAASLTKKISSIPAFQSILSPMKQTEEGWIPDFGSRYFTEDFSFGLRYLKELAIQYGVYTPIIDKVYLWGTNKVNK